MDHSYQAAELFLNGSNCAQAIAVAFCDVTGTEPELAARILDRYIEEHPVEKPNL